MVCAWCKKKTGRQSVERKNGLATHGLCVTCMKIHFPEEYAAMMREKRKNPADHADALEAREEAIDEANDFVRKFEDYESVMSGWTKDELLGKAKEAAQGMIAGKQMFRQGLYDSAVSYYENAKEELEKLTGRIGGSY